MVGSGLVLFLEAYLILVAPGFLLLLLWPSKRQYLTVYTLCALAFPLVLILWFLSSTLT